MGKVFPFDRAEAVSRAEAARRKAERDAAAAERAQQQHEEGAQAAAREREMHTEHQQKKAAEAAQEREERIRAAMERPKLEPERPALPDHDRKISIEVTRGDIKFETVETLRSLESLAAEYSRTFRRAASPEGTLEGTSRIAVEMLTGAHAEQAKEEGCPSSFPRRLSRCALAWFLLNAAEGPTDIGIADAGRIVVEVTPDGRRHRVGMWRAA